MSFWLSFWVKDNQNDKDHQMLSNDNQILVVGCHFGGHFGCHNFRFVPTAAHTHTLNLFSEVRDYMPMSANFVALRIRIF